MMEAEASGPARGARGPRLAWAQRGDAVQVRAEELCSAGLGPRRADGRQALAADQVRAAGDRRLAAGNASVAAAGARQEEVRPDEVGRKEDAAAAESQLGGHEEPEVQQSANLAELWEEEEQGPRRALVSVEQCVAEGEGLTHVVQVWADDASLGSGGKVWLDLQVGRQEEVLAEEPLVEAGEDEVPRGPDAAGQGDQEQRTQGPLAAGAEFVLEGAGCTLEGRVVEEAEEESQAETKERGQEPGKRGQAGPGPPGPSSWSPLEALEALQLEMEPVNEQARRAFSRLQLRTWQRRKPHLELRSSIIQRVRGFWAEAVLLRAMLQETGLEGHVLSRSQDWVCSGEESFVNHPQLSAMISDQDKSMLSFLVDLKVEKGSDRCKIVLSFRSNPYFRNDVVVKEYAVTLTGSRATYSTPIQWHRQYEREAYRRRHNNSSLNFFNWFSVHGLAGSGRIAEYICKDLWSNPLKYYRRKVAAVEGAEERTGEESLAGC